MKRSVVVLINGSQESALGVRARGLFEPMRERVEATYLYRESGRIRSIATFLRQVERLRPDFVYVLDVGMASGPAALCARLAFRTPFVLDSGDLAYELALATGRYGVVGRMLLRSVEALTHRFATATVVRGTYHRALLERSGRRLVQVIRDGTHLRTPPPADEKLRRALGLEGVLSVGLVGSIRWNRRTHQCYGWDLIEAMSLLGSGVQIGALIVGDGDGLSRLKRRAAELGVEKRVHFVGRVPYEEMPRYLGLLDVAISTQTDDDVGRVRTTGKLPEYMAAGCYVLATDVGEARLLLPREMRLPYSGSLDANYPERLAGKLAELAQRGPAELRAAARKTAARARRELDYDVLSAQLERFLTDLPAGATRRRVARNEHSSREQT